jgi:hypothetical protein
MFLLPIGIIVLFVLFLAAGFLVATWEG